MHIHTNVTDTCTQMSFLTDVMHRYIHKNFMHQFVHVFIPKLQTETKIHNEQACKIKFKATVSQSVKIMDLHQLSCVITLPRFSHAVHTIFLYVCQYVKKWEECNCVIKLSKILTMIVVMSHPVHTICSITVRLHQQQIICTRRRGVSGPRRIPQSSSQHFAICRMSASNVIVIHHLP